MSAAPLSFPVLIADIGGTNARFALVSGRDQPTERLAPVVAADHAGPIEAIGALGLTARGQRPRSAVLAMAGPVVGDAIPLTNSPWVIEPRRMLAELGLERVIVLNDFEALALALPAFGTDDVEQIGGGIPRPHAPMVVIGPGTGLGVAGLIHAQGRWVPVPGEGGHICLGPETAEEYRIWPQIEGFGRHIEAEHLLCGRGLMRLAEAIAGSDGRTSPYPSPADVTAGWQAGEELATRAVEMFAGLLGRVAGDLALVFLARGGVFIGGGVAGRIDRALTAGPFRAAFENKAPHDRLVAAMPTYLIREDLPALTGLAAYARAPESYALDLTGRVWMA